MPSQILVSPILLHSFFRVDDSDLHAYQARQQYASEILKGESGINLVAAALAVSIEDDALVSHSTVRLPEATFAKRIDVFSAGLERLHLSTLPNEASPDDIIEASCSPVLLWLAI